MGLLNEGMRYRDLETGLFISRDPAGFVDGPNVYTYVRQNPWSKFDPLGLRDEDFVPKPADFENVSPAERESYRRVEGKVGGYSLAILGGVITGGATQMGAGAILGGSTTATVGTATLSGATSSVVTKVGMNATDGKPLAEGTASAALTGVALGAVIQTGGNMLGAFGQGVREGKAIVTVKDLAITTAEAGVPSGAANVMVTPDGQVFTGLSQNAGGGSVSNSVKSLYGTARTTCAEARTLTAMEQAGVSSQGAVSASASVGVKGIPPGTPMEACRQACAPVLKNSKIGDAVAGTTPALPSIQPTVPVIPPTNKKDEE